MKGRRKWGAVFAVAAALCAAAVFTGCGSDSDTNASATDEAAAPLSKAQFVKQAEKICKQELKKKDAAVAAGLKELTADGEPPSIPELSELLEEGVLPVYRNVIDQIGELGAPKADEAEIKQLVSEYESALQASEADPGKVLKASPFLSVDQKAVAYGIENCPL